MLFNHNLNQVKFESNLPVITYNPRLLNQIGQGSEGTIYSFGDYAVKIFNGFNYKDIRLKYQKIEELSKLSSPYAVFPKGLVKNEDNYIIGYFMSYIDKSINLDRIKVEDYKKFRNSLIQLSIEMEKLNKNGLLFGDLKGDNILVNSNYDMKFIDIDNSMYKEYEFDVYGFWHKLLEITYQKKYNQIDCDKFAIAITILDRYMPNLELKTAFFTYLKRNDNFQLFKMIINNLEINVEAREILELILLDSDDKPYIHSFLEKITNDPIMDRINAKAIRKRYVY